MDRGYKNYFKLINDLSRKYHVEGRVLYVHDTHLPVLLRKALGCITINSTVGLSAILEGCPTKVCGNAFYNFEGLSYPKNFNFFGVKLMLINPILFWYVILKNIFYKLINSTAIFIKISF